MAGLVKRGANRQSTTVHLVLGWWTPWGGPIPGIVAPQLRLKFICFRHLNSVFAGWSLCPSLTSFHSKDACVKDREQLIAHCWAWANLKVQGLSCISGGLQSLTTLPKSCEVYCGYVSWLHCLTDVLRGGLTGKAVLGLLFTMPCKGLAKARGSLEDPCMSWMAAKMTEEWQGRWCWRSARLTVAIKVYL